MNEEVHRTSFDLNAEALTFEKLTQMILKFFPILDGKSYRVCYRDDEDLITFSTNEELTEAIMFMSSKASALRFTLLFTTTDSERAKSAKCGSAMEDLSAAFEKPSVSALFWRGINPSFTIFTHKYVERKHI